MYVFVFLGWVFTLIKIQKRSVTQIFRIHATNYELFQKQHVSGFHFWYVKGRGWGRRGVGGPNALLCLGTMRTGMTLKETSFLSLFLFWFDFHGNLNLRSNPTVLAMGRLGQLQTRVFRSGVRLLETVLGAKWKSSIKTGLDFPLFSTSKVSRGWWRGDTVVKDTWCFPRGPE